MRARSLLLAALLLTWPGTARLSAAGADPKEVKEIADRAIAFLRKSQSPDGSFSAARTGPGVSALVVAGLLRHGVAMEDPLVARTLASMEKSVKPDGGIYSRGLANYTTSVALMAFKEANTGGRYDAILKNGSQFLRGLQQGDTDDVRAGGVGYDGRTRPDLSNTQFFIDAMVAAGVKKDDPALQRALKFVSRCQNLPGETNDQPFAAKTTPDDRGGLTYTPIDPDDSPHRTPAGGLRSLGAMTYGGLKSFLYAGVTKDDPRVKGALDWIRRHYTLAENPGMGKAGLYYYYHTFAKAMEALGEDTFEDSEKVKHDWRKELVAVLKEQQRPDGSFINAEDRAFGEADPNLATAFALLALSYCK